MQRRLKRFTALLVISLILTGTIDQGSYIFASEISPETNGSGGEKTGSEEIMTGSSNGIPEISETRKISSVEDLKELSEKSRDESYTRGVRYVLQDDLDLTGSDLNPISIFAGEFDGQGHWIKGFSLSGRQDNSGFIRTVTAGGRVHDLNLSGILEPVGDMTGIGGIVGINYGLLENLSFDGRILSIETVGGIAGHNMESGVIRNCSNSGVISAMRRTGGISGFNEGTIENCENKGEVNVGRKTAHEVIEERETPEEAEDEDGVLDKLIADTLDIKDENLFDRFDNDVRVSYTGGIAGASSGLIKDSVNSGIVGSSHVGYETGGITGYDRGIITGCRNKGSIFGRKDVGGIAGLFEPYALNAYSEDALNRAGDSLEELTDRIERFHKDFGAEDDLTQSHIDAVRATSDDLRALIKYYKEYFRCKDDSVEREIRSKVDGIRSIADSISLRKYDKETKEALQVFIDNSDNIAKLVESWSEARAAGITADMSEFIAKLKDIGRANNEAVDTLMRKAVRVNKDADDIEDDLEELRSASMDLDDYLRGCEDDYKKDLRITSDDIQTRTDLLADEMDVLSEGLKGSDAKLRTDVDNMVSSLNSLNESISDSYKEIQSELQKIYDADGKEDVFDDISDDESTELKKGVLLYSENEGDVESDINGGGIVGVITDDSSIRSDFEVVSEGQVSLNYDRYEKATVLYCKNSGDVTVRNDCAGGVAGRSDLGALIFSDNFGRVESTEGSYAGGIAGRSASVIRGCRSMCEAVGESYAGGIAGLARSLVDNICLSAVDKEKEYHGAVAGDTDNRDLKDEDKGKVSGNIFVFRGLGAINGVTDENEAKSVSYEELLEMDGIPSDFGKMTVTFKDKGRTVAKLKVPYGGRVDGSKYPELKESSDGKFGYWENTDLSNIQQNITVEAVYVDYITSVASDNSEKPGMILNGRFYDGTALTYTEEDMNEEASGGNRIYRSVSFEVNNEFGIPENTEYTVRYRTGGVGKNDVVLIKNGGGHVPVESRIDGNYIIFKMKDTGTFYLAGTRKARLETASVIALIAASLILILVMVLSSLRKRRRQKSEQGGS